MPVDLEDSRLTKETVLANIPAFPPIVLRVLGLLSADRPDMVPLVREIGSDATLSAQVLRMANSPLFGLAAQVDTVHRAVVTLGFVRVQSLVLAVATRSYMQAALRTEAMSKCWRHALASAVLCRELAQAAGLPRDRAYSFGLLHDIGRLGLLVAYPHDYDRLLDTADRDAVSLLDLEKKRFGMDHCEAGRRLVEDWGLPPEFRVIAGRHHDPPSGAPFDPLTLAHLACQMADTLGYFVAAPLKAAGFEELLARLPAATREQFPDDPGVLQQTVERALGEDRSDADSPDDDPDEDHSADSSRGASSSDPSAPSPRLSREGDGSRQAAIQVEASPAPKARWDAGTVLLAVMVLLLVLTAGALCFWNA